MNELFPFEPNYFDRGAGIRMHYVDEGPRDAPVVVMVHGNPTWSFYYRHVILALRDRYRCVAMDHVGMGKSDKPGDGAYRYTLDSRVEDLERLLDRLELKSDVTLLLHDWGGMIGMAMASRNPGRIARLMLLNTGAFPLPAGKALPLSIRICRTFLGPALVQGLNFFARGAAMSCVTRRPLTPAVRQGFVSPYDSWGNRIATLRFVEDIPLKEGDAAWATVKKTEAALAGFRDRPALICWGGKDFVFDDHFLERWRAHLPEAAVKYYADAGHYVLEDARDEVIGEITKFLATR